MKKKRTFKRVIIAGIILAFIVGAIHVISMLTIDRKLQYKEEQFTADNIPDVMDGYRIAFITDTHAITEEDMQAVVDELNKKNLDLLLLGGDFAVKGEALKRIIELISATDTTDGIYGVEGNHDNHAELFDVMNKNGIEPLSNSGLYIKNDFYLAGVEDLWNRNPDIQRAVEEAKPDDLTILLAHNADVTMQQDTTGVDLVLSGHTHGGQITFFGLWAPDLALRKTITDYGQRFMSGWCENENQTPVYVSRGTGYLNKVPRIFARPQIIIIELKK